LKEIHASRSQPGNRCVDRCIHLAFGHNYAVISMSPTKFPGNDVRDR